MGSLLIGTTSWSEKTLLESGRFYPPSARMAEDRLRYYASRFPVVEVDSTYYALLSERNARLWAERTPAGFIFDVKVFRLFTQHQTPLRALPADLREGLRNRKDKIYQRDLPTAVAEEIWERFRSALEPLKASGKLGALLFQFPPWFLFEASNLDYIAGLGEKLPGCRIGIEFRHRSWWSERRRSEVLEFERENHLIHVVVDGPQGFTSSVPAVWEVTARDLAIVRLHGRNRETWEKKGLETAADRFNYLYSREELEGLAPPIRGLADGAAEVHVLFNNCHHDHAQRNALELVELIEGRGDRRP